MKIITKIVEELVILIFVILLSYVTFKHNTSNVVVIYLLFKIYIEQLRSEFL